MNASSGLEIQATAFALTPTAAARLSRTSLAPAVRSWSRFLAQQHTETPRLVSDAQSPLGACLDERDIESLEPDDGALHILVTSP